MNADILNTIEVLNGKIRSKEEEANKLKKLVNELCVEAEVEIRYPDISENSGGLSTIRADQFYGQTLTAAIRNYLERRKTSGLGAASLTEIYRAIREGGYKFETTSEDNAKISVSNALRKTSSIFHKLPNGQYGLLAWYPSAKAPKEGDKPKTRKNNRGSRKATLALPEKSGSETSDTNGHAALVSQQEVRDVILSREGEFQASDIEEAIKAKFPSKTLPATKVSTVLFVLKKEKGLIREVSPRVGTRGAIYAKA